MSEPSTISAATIRNAAEDGSAGTTTSAPCSSGWPVSAMPAAVAAFRRRGDLGAKMLQQQLGMVAARFLLDHRGDAGRGEPRQRHCRFDLRRGHWRLVKDRHRVARAVQRQRRAAAFPVSPVRAPINSRGSRIRRIGRERSQASPSKTAVIRAAGHRPHDQSAAGAGICRNPAGARIGAASRRRRHPAPDQANGPVRSTFAPSACMDLAVLITSSLSSRPETVVSPTAKCAQDQRPGAKSTCRRERGLFRSKGRLERASSGEGVLEWVKIVSSRVAAGIHRAAPRHAAVKSRTPLLTAATATSQVKHRFSERFLGFNTWPNPISETKRICPTTGRSSPT